MTRKHIALVAGLTLLIGGCATNEMADAPAPIGEKQAKLLDKELSGKVAGTPVNCISNTHQNSAIAISDDMLLYRVSGRLVYQNRLRGSCPGLVRRDDIMVMETFGSQYCRGDIIRLVDRYSGINGPACVLGEFVPYRKISSAATEAQK
jgi:hypothetical protein